MASSLLAAAKPSLLLFSSPPPLPPRRRSLQLSRKTSSVKVAALAQKWEPSKVVPQADRVLIRLEALPEKSAGGVLLPKAAVKFERYLMGEVLSVGADVGEVEAGKKNGLGKILEIHLMGHVRTLGLYSSWCGLRKAELPVSR